MRRIVAPLALAGAVLLAVGCAPVAPADQPTTTTPAAEASPAPSPTAETPPAAFVLPPCGDLYDPALLGASAEQLPPPTAGATLLPALEAVFAGIPETQTCLWVIPNSDGSFGVSVAPIDAAMAAAVRAVLEAEGFAIAVWGDGFRAERDAEGELSLLTEAHGVHAGWWLSAAGAGSGAAAVLDGMAAAVGSANPAWTP